MPDVIVERAGSVAIVRLNRPGRNNAMGGTMLRELVEAYEDADRNDDVGCIVTIGEGKTFCVGADLAEMGQLEQQSDEPTYQLLAGGAFGGDYGAPPLSDGQRKVDPIGMGRWVQRLWAIEKPMIAAVNGVAAGGGFSLAVLHDFRVAADSAKLGTAFVRLGVGPDLGVSWLLPRLVGWQKAMDLLLRSPMLSAEEAARIGLVDETVPAGELLDSTMARAQELAALPPSSVRMTKRLLRRARTATLDEQLEAEWQTQLLLFDLPETRAMIAMALQFLAQRA